MKTRCINIDWLEVYCLEDITRTPCDAAYFRKYGLIVHEREYGTRMYREMFTIYDEHDQPSIEIRRNPYSTEGRDRGFFPPESCHIRLHNSTCYSPNPIGLLRDFLVRHNYTLKKIYRLDICLDFELFDKGDNPQKFIQRYMAGRYSKVNQARIAAHGEDTWAGRTWQSLSWGQPKSMVSTKLYSKTVELEQTHDKPYIVWSWFHNGLIDDPINRTKHAADGSVYKPVIWRVEFSIKSSANRWFVIEKSVGKRGQIVIPHTLDLYDTPMKLITIFASLAQHYFHFKVYEDGKRKDRCSDKILFDFSPQDLYFRVDRLASHTANTSREDRLTILLNNFRETHPLPDINKAVDTLLDAIQSDKMHNFYGDYLTRKERWVLTTLFRERLEGNTHVSISEREKQLTEWYDQHQPAF